VDVSTLVATIDRAVQHPDASPPPVWQNRAACYGLDPEVFFPTTEEEASLALSFCGACRVRQDCLTWALWQGERYGVWGGTTEQQRREMRLIA
jgi:WhiB family redox-sensing transcriptional regulator